MTDTTTRRPPRAETVLRALNVAAIHLDWLTGHDGGPDRYQLALDILDDPTTLVRSDGDRPDDTGIRSKGGHSDPTGDAACPDPKLRICGQTRNASEHRRALATSAVLIACTADDMQTLASVILGYRLPELPVTIQGARTAALWCLTAPHSIERAVTATDDPEERLELSAAVELLAEQTTTLQTTVAGILRTAAHPPTTKPKQKPRLGCQDCARHGVKTDVAPNSKTRCEKCLRFRREYRVPPTSEIVRSWANGRERLTPSMIAEAIAIVTPKTKRTA